MRRIKVAVSFTLVVTAFAALAWAFAPGARARGLVNDGIWETSRGLAGQSALRLNRDALAQLLSRAPMEGSAELAKSGTLLSLPIADGSWQRFQVEESPIMEPALAAQLPEVKTYRGRGIDDPRASTRFSLTPEGFRALVLSPQGASYVEPARGGSSYVVHSGDTLPGTFRCGVSEADVAEATARGIYASRGIGATSVSNGSTLRTYRLAVATTGEWYNLYGGGSVANAQSAIVSIINLVDAIYERDVAIRFTVVNNTNIIFTNPSTDPYSTNAADSTTLSENQSTLDNATFLGSANYDIGHVFGGITGLPSGSTSFSGLASVGVSCTNGLKARGVSTMGNNPASPTAGIFINGVAHEIGHQFSATHTFNATAGSCGPQRDGSSAYEVGGGSTIMSYQICAAENLQPQSDSYFHVRSLEQIVNYATSSGVCAAATGTGNNPPIVSGPGNFTIPANTPFQLAATASDTNGSLTYSWEEYDLGAAGPPDTDDGSRPIFRGYRPAAVPTRFFPSLQYILNNMNVPPLSFSGSCSGGSCLTGESLPTSNRTMTFQLVVRDNQGSGGAINTATSVLTVTNSAGPFAVTAPNGGESWSGAQNVTWNVANTNNSPVNAGNVKITLSTDGGQSFPQVLAASVANNGSAPVTLPNGIFSSTCRIKVEAVGNIFFDVSNANFTLSPADTCPAISDITPKAGGVGNSVIITGTGFNGVTSVTFGSNVSASFTVNNDTTITATVPAGASGGPITVSEPGCASVQSTAYSFCSSGPFVLAVDDGSLNGASGFPTNGTYYVNRLTPASYPATLTQIAIYWDPFLNVPPGTSLNIVAGSNPSGSSDINGTSFQSFAGSSGTSGFSTYTLPNALTITSGDFVVGYQVPVYPSNSFPAAVDSTSPQGRSYASTNGTTFSLQSGNFMIRAAQVFTGCGAGVPALRMVSINRTGIGHFIVQAIGAPNQVNNLQAAPDVTGPYATLVPPPPPADNSGFFQYDDAAAGLPRRFYRVAYP